MIYLTCYYPILGAKNSDWKAFIELEGPLLSILKEPCTMFRNILFLACFHKVGLCDLHAVCVFVYEYRTAHY
jgi:hypothetical protein